MWPRTEAPAGRLRPTPLRMWSRRQFLGSALAAGAVLALPAAGPVRAEAGSMGMAASGLMGMPAAAEPAGLVALPRGREIALVRPDTAETRTVVTLESGEFIADVALSPDGTRVAFGLFTARTGDGAGGSDIVIAPIANGAERTVVVPRDRAGMLLAAPQWSPDGQALVFEAVGLSATGQAAVTAEWVAVDGTGRRTVAQAARYPSFSPDGVSVIYTRALPTGDALWESPVAGGEGREIVADSRYLVIVYPRYSPDGSVIAFGGVDNALPISPFPGSLQSPGGPIPTPPLAPKLLSSVGAADPLRPQTVLAHGFPAEPFVVSPSGTNARRLAQLPIDDAAVAWSPDGAWVAVSGASGLFLVSAADGEVRRVTEIGSFGAIDSR